MVATREVSRKELISVLCGLIGAKPVTITAETEPRVLKTGNPHPNPKKLATVNGMLNFHYDQGVLRRLVKERKSLESFVRGTSWHVPIVDTQGRLTPFCKNKSSDDGKLYLRFMFREQIGEPLYYDENHKPLASKDIIPYLPERNLYSNQGLSKPLEFKTYDVENIRELTVDGVHYIVR